MAVKLFEDKAQCSGCGACRNICPQNAISMGEDAEGFLYPRVDAAACVECGACLRVCPMQNPVHSREPQKCYAAVANEKAVLKSSASGGGFAVLAAGVLSRGGVVYGVAMPLQEEGFQPKHIRITDSADLPKLQGSKYVQSDTHTTAAQVRADLIAGKEVLYSGTPCQIAGLQNYLGKDYDKLLTAEVICHGVPSARMFRDFVKCLEDKQGRRVERFDFRTKGRSSVKQAQVRYEAKDGDQQLHRKEGDSFSYLFYFMRGVICRESCYSCPFAQNRRVADITLGDYWGFHQEHPQVSPGKTFKSEQGISCILINSEKADQAIKECGTSLSLVETSLHQIAKHNGQLCAPTQKGGDRDMLLQMYRQKGYVALEEYFESTCRAQRIRGVLAARIPGGIKRTGRRLIGLLQGNAAPKKK